MRITPQQLQIQLHGVNRNNELNQNFNIGQLITGTITNVEEGQITFMTEGQEPVTASVEDASRFVSGERLVFQVLESNSDVFRLTVVNDTAQRVNLTPVPEQLEHLQLSDSRENIQAFEVLQSLDMPVTRENIQGLTQNYQAVNVLHEMIQRVMPESLRNESPDILNLIARDLNLTENSELLNRPLREIALQILERYPEGLRENLPIAERTTRPVLQSEAAQVPLEARDLNLSPSDFLSRSFGLIEDLNQGRLNIQETMVRLGQLIQLDKPMTLNSLSLLDRLNMDEGFQRQTNELIEILSQDETFDRPQLLSLLRGFDVTTLQSSQDVQVYFERLLIELQAARYGLSEKAKFPAELLKDSIRFLEQDQPLVTWIQMPIKIDTDIGNLDLLVKEDYKNNTKNKPKTKILISLDTHYLERVQALIEVQSNKINISFKVANDEIKNLFVKQLSSLENELKDEKEHVQIEVKSQAYVDYSDFVKSPYAGGFDMTV
jgi:hypothetical protein